jgi:hypothetical protein
MIVGGNMDLSHRPQTYNPKEGGMSSVYSMTIGVEENGKEITVLIPRVMPDGKIVSPEKAIAHFKKTGKHMGKFRTRKEADRYSRDYSELLGKKK